MSRVSMMNVIRQMLYCYYIDLMNMCCKKKFTDAAHLVSVRIRMIKVMVSV